MLHDLQAEMQNRGIALRIVGARGYVRDFLRADGISEKVGGIDKVVTIQDHIDHIKLTDFDAGFGRERQDTTPKYTTSGPSL
jgi:hypothetical protein